MKTIRSKNPKFTNEDENENKLKVALDRVIFQYKEEKGSIKGGVQLFMKAVVMLSLYIIPFVLLILFSPPFWIAIFLLAILIVGKIGVGLNIMHDAVHESFSEYKWVNWLMSRSIYLLGDNLKNWQIQHNYLHHQYTNIDGIDEDIKPRSWLRFSPYSPYKKIHRFQYIYAPFLYSLLTLNRFVGDFFSLFHYIKLPLIKKYQFNLVHECIKVVALKMVYIFICIILPILLTDYTWWQVLVAFILVHMISSVPVAFIFQSAHVVEGVGHYPEIITGKKIQTNFVVHEIATTCDFKTTRFLSWFMGGLDFQVEHHLFSNTSHIHYNQLSIGVEKVIKKFGFKYHKKPGFIPAVISHIKQLKF